MFQCWKRKKEGEMGRRKGDGGVRACFRLDMMKRWDASIFSFRDCECYELGFSSSCAWVRPFA